MEFKVHKMTSGIAEKLRITFSLRCSYLSTQYHGKGVTSMIRDEGHLLNYHWQLSKKKKSLNSSTDFSNSNVEMFVSD
jgi:hypothetical protein